MEMVSWCGIWFINESQLLQDTLRQWLECRTSSTRCRITRLAKDSEGRCIGGVVQMSCRGHKYTDDKVRIWFDRENTFLYDTCLGKADLAYFTETNSLVKIFFNRVRIKNKLVPKRPTVLQWGLEIRTQNTERHSKTEQKIVRF